MVPVSLREFLSTGRFGPVGLGATREAVRRAFGPPDDRDARARTDEAAGIWKYGDIELHFGKGGGDASLWLVYADAFSVPQGGPNIDLDPWILSRALCQHVAEAELTAAGVAYTSGRYDWDEDAEEIRTSAGVSLIFEGKHGASSRDRLLLAISFSRQSR